ncbi:MAG: tetratricopeptide repeat protein [Pseudomonadota bacterium]
MFGHEHTELDKGLDAFAARNWRKARRLLEDAVAEDDRAVGHYHLGLLYWRGLGGDKDHKAAVRCFARAADGGHAAAQTALGMAILAGVGAPQSETEARALFRHAAGAGDVEAMTQLAALSEHHDAMALLRRAADEGHPPAMRELSGRLLKDDPVEALGWLYVHVGLTGDHTVSHYAEKLAREMRADEISEAQKFGRGVMKRLKQEKRTR